MRLKTKDNRNRESSEFLVAGEICCGSNNLNKEGLK